MSQYIDADSVLEHIDEHKEKHPSAYHLTTYAELLIADEPTVDAAEVVHGKWVEYGRECGYLANCSRCGFQIDVHGNRGYCHYCPNCEEKMDGIFRYK